MTKEDILKLMVDSINQDNLEMAERANMDKDQIDRLVQESQMSLQYMMTNLYERMQAADILKV